MLRLKAFIVLILFSIMVIMSYGCNEFNNDVQINKLKYYTTDSQDQLYKFIKSYNLYCLENYDESYQIEIVVFDSEDELYTKMSTEIMAGYGPDIFTTEQKLPFEKLMENIAFLDINELVEKDNSDNRLNFEDYNSVIMNAGVKDGKRYIIPLYYCVDALVTTKERVNSVDININNGEVLTYNNLDKVFKPYFSNNNNYAFVSNELAFLLWFDYPMQLFNRYINSFVDFENRTTSFDTEKFRDSIDVMCELVRKSKESGSACLFDDLYLNRSFPLITGNYSYYKTEGQLPVVVRGIVADEDTYSANIEMGIAINCNSKLQDKAYTFIKYLLSEKVQTEFANSSTSLSFPVNKAAYDKSKYTASKRTDDDEKIIGIDNNFVKSYMEIVDNVNVCTLYRDVSHSYYNSSVVGEIVDNYLSEGLSKEKFIRQLTAATEIYLAE